MYLCEIWTKTGLRFGPRNNINHLFFKKNNETIVSRRKSKTRLKILDRNRAIWTSRVQPPLWFKIRAALTIFEIFQLGVRNRRVCGVIFWRFGCGTAVGDGADDHYFEYSTGLRNILWKWGSNLDRGGQGGSVVLIPKGLELCRWRWWFPASSI